MPWLHSNNLLSDSWCIYVRHKVPWPGSVPAVDEASWTAFLWTSVSIWIWTWPYLLLTHVLLCTGVSLFHLTDEFWNFTLLYSIFSNMKRFYPWQKAFKIQDALKRSGPSHISWRLLKFRKLTQSFQALPKTDQKHWASMSPVGWYNQMKCLWTLGQCTEPYWGVMPHGRNLTLAKDKGFGQESDIRA